MQIISVHAHDGSLAGALTTDAPNSSYGIPVWVKGACSAAASGAKIQLITDGDKTQHDAGRWDYEDGAGVVLYADDSWAIVDVPEYSDPLWALNMETGTYHRVMYRRDGERRAMAIDCPDKLADEFDYAGLPGEGLTPERVKLAIDLGKLTAEDTLPDWSEDRKSLGLVLA